MAKSIDTSQDDVADCLNKAFPVTWLLVYTVTEIGLCLAFLSKPHFGSKDLSATSRYLTSLTLLARIGANDQEAWQRFVELYAPLVYSWSRNAGVPAVDVADIGQEVFRVVAKRISRFQPELKSTAGFRSWLWGITRLRILEHFRVEGRQVNAGGDVDSVDRIQLIEEQQDVPESINGNTPQQLVVQTAIDILRSECEATTWQAFWRMAVDDQAAADVAQELGMKTSAVRQAKFRVTRKLRLLLDSEIAVCSAIPESRSD